MKRNAIFLSCFWVLVLVAQEVTFDSAPYIKALIQEGGKDYRSIAKAQIGAGYDGHNLKAGLNRIIIQGREPGARLEQLWIGPSNQRPEWKNNGVFLDIDTAVLTTPMHVDSSSDPAAIITDTPSRGCAEFTVNIPTDGNCAVWAKGHGLNPSADSFFLKVNNEETFAFDVPIWKRSSWYRVVGRSHSYYSFLYVWNATSPHSPHHRDEQYYQLSLKLLEASIHEIKLKSTFPGGLWYLNTLEAMHMILKDRRTTVEQRGKLLKLMRPHVDLTCRTAESTENSWANNAVNIWNQRAAILALASDIWRDIDPDTSQRWLALARKCVHTVASWFPPGKPYGYDSYGSGFDAEYYTYDAKFLTRYYLITGDETARQMIAGYASAAHNVSRYGHIISASSPWWKHSYNAFNNPYMPLRNILEYSRDPIYARLLLTDLENKDDKIPRDWLIVYYNTLTPPVTIEPSPPFADLSFFAENENGPALRMGNLNIVMPWRSWCESTCAFYYSTPKGCVSHVPSIILTAVDKKERGYYPGAYSVAEQLNNKPEARAAIIGDDFIAAATTFRPALGGPALPNKAGQPNNSPWLRTDIWFADRNGAAGFLELKALKDNHSFKVSAWPYVSSNAKISGSEIRLEGLTVKPGDNIVPLKKLGQTWANYPLDLFESVLKESNGFKAGETFHLTPTVTLNDGQDITIRRRTAKNDIYEFELISGDRTFIMIFNRSGNNQKRNLDGIILQSTAIKTEKLNPGNINLLKNSLTIVY